MMVSTNEMVCGLRCAEDVSSRSCGTDGSKTLEFRSGGNKCLNSVGVVLGSAIKKTSWFKC